MIKAASYVFLQYLLIGDLILN